MALLVTAGTILGAWGCGVRPGPGSGIHEDKGQDGVDDRLCVVTTIFPYYDFVRQIAGDRVKLKLVVPAGMDSHSFEPTPADIRLIQNADLLICNGGAMEQWVSQVVASLDSESLKVITMMDYVDTVEEEIVEGMEDAGEEHPHSHASADDTHDDHDHDEHEHHHEHGEGCTCGCHDHEHEHGHHHADDVFTSWGKETPHKFERAKLEEILKQFVEDDKILRSKGMVEGTDGKWIYFDMVPGEYEIRDGEPDYTGRIVVIGTDIHEHELEELFGLA